VRCGGPDAALQDIADLDPTWSRQVSVVDAAGVRHAWHVLDNGVGNPIGTLLCVHGNPTWSYLWRGLLASAPPGWRVVAPDQLGMGFSQRPASQRRLAQRVRDLADLTEALGVDGPVVTVGHDWGGPISLGWGLDHPQQLLGVVLANTAVTLPADDRGPALIRLARLPFLREAVCVRTPVFVRAAAALSRPALSADVRRALAGPYAGAARRQAVGDFVADIPFGPAHPSRPALEAIAAGVGSLDVPALLLWGPRDPVFGEQHLRDLRRRLPQAQLHRYEGASHLVTEDAPQYAEAVARWVSDLTATNATPASTSPAALRAPAPAGRTLWSALGTRADDQSPAVVEVGGRTLSWAELARRVGELAAGMGASGVQPGDRVALLVPPSAELTAVVYALWRAGAVVVVADQGLGFAGMRRALRSAAVDHVVGTPAGLAAARLMRLPGRRIAAGANGAISRRVLEVEHHLDDLAGLGRGADLPSEPSPEQECAVVFTSGATGPAKGVVYRHRQVLAQLQLLASTYGLTPSDRLVAAFAPFALLGPALGIGSAVPDIDVTAPATLTAATLAEAASVVDATVVFASPAALRGVSASTAALSAEHRAALGRIRLLISAGAPVPAWLLHSLSAVLPRAQAHTPYGMTEVLPVTDVSLEEIDSAAAGEGVCVGRPLPGVDLAVSPLSASGGADAPLTTTPEVTGEVCVRAAHVMDRYDALWWTQRASSRNPGWHRSGDVGHLDRQGRLWIEGRLAHVLTTAAGALTPVGIEQRVETLDTVESAAAVGVGPAGAQVVVVVVVPAGGSPTSRVAASRGPALASPPLTDAVRKVAGVEVAAVLVRRQLPLDIRHAAKVDRRELAGWATGALCGSTSRWGGVTRR
jgi:olefin beta-lactone synthetase